MSHAATSLVAHSSVVESGLDESHRRSLWKAFVKLCANYTGSPQDAATGYEAQMEAFPDILKLTSKYTQTRIVELRRMNMIEKVGERICNESGNLCNVYIPVPQGAWIEDPGCENALVPRYKIHKLLDWLNTVGDPEARDLFFMFLDHKGKNKKVDWS